MIHQTRLTAGSWAASKIPGAIVLLFVTVFSALSCAQQALPPAPTAAMIPPATQPVEARQWDIFEITLHGTATGNPFDVRLSAKFTLDKTVIETHGFYDGEGVYRIRFMPQEQGVWKYETASDLPELSGQAGQFTCTKPVADSHGPVVAHNTFYFSYADGTPFFPISTTLYGWAFQKSDELQEQTLASLKQSPFNRIRMMVLPIRWGKDNEPPRMPFEKNSDGSWNFSRFDPEYFQRLEHRLAQLRDLGIEAELILFHNRDGGQTNFDRMPEAADDRYLHYVVARLSAYRNVWWNMANEFDSLRNKTDADWDRFFKIVAADDPVQHLRSVHQQHRYYDMSHPWVTYLSVQYETPVLGFGRPPIFRQIFRKPIIFDEVKYEGDIPQNWGHLDGQDMVQRFWYGIIGGTYVSHGETFASAPGVTWISRGGKLVGESPVRIAFLKDIIANAPGEELSPIEPENDQLGIAGKPGQYYLVYFGHNAPAEWKFELPVAGYAGAGGKFKIDVIDTWNMTITPVDEVANMKGIFPRTRTRSAATTAPATPSTQPNMLVAEPAVTVKLPGRKYMAIRIQRVE